MSQIPIEPATTDAAFPETMEWHSLPRAAARVMTVGSTLWGLILGLATTAFFGWGAHVELGIEGAAAWTVAGMVVLAWVLVAARLGYLRWKCSRWRLDGTGLHVRRGRVWRKEILIPLSRVQHLDIERGPMERHFGLATLIVHTAGTRQHALRQPGLAEADAVALRDALVPASSRHDDVV